MLTAVAKTGSGTVGAVIFGVLTTKIIAVFAGPSGTGLFSLLRQIQLTFTGLATMQGNTALVQGLSSREAAIKNVYAGTVAILFLLAGAVVCLVVWFLSPQLAEMTLDRKDDQAVWLIRGLIPGIVSASAVLYLGSLLNSYRAIGRLALVQFLSAAGGALAAYPLVVWIGNPWGLLFLLWVMSGIGLCAGIFFTWRGGWLGPVFKNLFTLWNSKSALYFIRFSGIVIVTGLAGTGSVLFVRALFVQHGGLASAGIFDAAWTLSTAYLMILLTSLGTYYTPTLAATVDPQARIVLMKQVFRVITLLVVPLITLVILGKSFVVSTIYSKQFLSSIDIIQWMLIGDFFKTAGWVFATPMLAFAKLRTFFWIEILWNAGMMVGAWAALFIFNMPWMVGAVFLCLCIFYSVFCCWYARTRYGLRLTLVEVRTWLIGLILIVSASLWTWGETRVDLLKSVIFSGAITFFIWLGTNKAERKKLLNYAREKVSLWRNQRLV